MNTMVQAASMTGTGKDGNQATTGTVSRRSRYRAESTANQLTAGIAGTKMVHQALKTMFGVKRNFHAIMSASTDKIRIKKGCVSR